MKSSNHWTQYLKLSLMHYWETNNCIQKHFWYSWIDAIGGPIYPRRLGPGLNGYVLLMAKMSINQSVNEFLFCFLLMHVNIQGKRSRGRQRLKRIDNIKRWTGEPLAVNTIQSRNIVEWRSMVANLRCRNGTKLWWWWFGSSGTGNEISQRYFKRLCLYST
jgi:hypothetical protein